jgi:glycosyltransferase involved in cell wall biosynthesis
VEAETEVSVVIPTRGRWSLLRDTLASALAQRDVPLEVVVVDDGSSDETSAELGEVRDERLRVVRHERPLGVAAARNRGIEEARGTWVAFLDDDDLWSPDKLSIQLDAIHASDAGFAYSAVVAVDRERRATRALPFPQPKELMRLQLRQNVVPAGGSNVISRTELLRTLGGFDEQLYHLADWDLWIRLGDAAPAAASPEVSVAYLEHGMNMHLTELPRIRREFEYLVEKHRALSEQYGVAFDREGFDLYVAWAHRRSGHPRKAAAIYLRSALAHRRPKHLARAVWMLTPGISTQPTAPPLPPQPAWLTSFRAQAASTL